MPDRYRRYVVFAVLGALTWVSLLAVLWAHESELVFGAGLTRWPSDPIDRTVFRPVSFPTTDRLRLDALVADRDGAGYWVLFCGGSRSTIHAGWVQQQLETLRTFGYGVLAFDYRGFGKNAGVPTEQGLHDDARAAYRYLTEGLKVPSSRVIIAGRSLGSAVALELARRVPTAGLVLFSPIDSVPMTGARLYFVIRPIAHLARARFDNRQKVAHIGVPILIVHAVADEWVPISVARSLFQSLPGDKSMLETAGGHNDAGFESAAALREAFGRWPPAADE